jgi:NitT/TauT family transport system permease protein
MNRLLVGSRAAPWSGQGVAWWRRPGRLAESMAILNRALSLMGLVLLWWVGARLAGSPQLLPGPGAVLAYAARTTVSGELPAAFAATLARVAIAFAAALGVGTAIGYLAGRSPRFDAAIDPWLVVALNLPVLVVIVLAYIWVGLNEVAAVLAVAIAKVPTVIITVREGARAFDPGFDDLATVYRLPRHLRLRRIALPQLAPYLAAAGRGGLAITWKIVLIVELLGRPNGVGFELNLCFQNFDVTGILAYGLGFAALMLAVEATLLRPWERHANAWRRVGRA